jgi:ubiquitin C-terminal hydrolase
VKDFVRNGQTTNVSLTYNTFGISNHMMFKSVGGHYTSYVAVEPKISTDTGMSKIMGKEQWFKFDDDIVEPIDKEEVVTKDAFILFMKRKEFKASTIANLIIKD